MGKRISAAKFAELYEAETGFEMMERDGRTTTDHIRHNVQWFRDWAGETARRLEDMAEHVRGYTS